jgi:hypothetical protein
MWRALRTLLLEVDARDLGARIEWLAWGEGLRLRRRALLSGLLSWGCAVSRVVHVQDFIQAID